MQYYFIIKFKITTIINFILISFKFINFIIKHFMDIMIIIIN